GWIRALSPALAQPTKKNSTEGLMNQDIFTFIEYEPLWVSVAGELQEAAHELKQDPKKFIADLFRGDPLQAKRKRYLRMGITAAMFAWIFTSILYLGWYYYKAPQTTAEIDQFHKIADLTP